MTDSLLSAQRLREFSIFREMPDPELDAARARMSLHRYTKGETIIDHLDEGADVYLLLTGQLLANRYSAAGREISYRRIPANSYFGELATFDGRPRSVNVSALTDADVGIIPQALFRELIAASPTFTQALLSDLAGRVRELSDRIYETTASSVKARLYSELVRTAMATAPQGNAAVLSDPPTHAEWAALIGGQRETVTRSLSELAHQGLLEKRGRDLVIHDIDALLELAEHA